MKHRKPAFLLLTAFCVGLTACAPALPPESEPPAPVSTTASTAVTVSTTAAPTTATTTTVAPTTATTTTVKTTKTTKTTATAAARTAREIIADLVRTYGFDPDGSAARVDRLLTELDAADGMAGKKWRQIMDYWAYANGEMPVCVSGLPTGLPEDGRLCIVVLGFELKADGGMKPELISRLTRALEMAEQYPQAYVLCTGGGTAKKARDKTEAGQMAAWLTAHGVAQSRLIVEDQSKTTGENALFSYDILRKRYPSVSELAIVSTDYHVPWGAVLFEARCLLGGGCRVTANAACTVAAHEDYPFYFQAAGLLEVAGMKTAAKRVYAGKKQ